MTFKVDSHKKPLQNCFKTYKYCDNTLEYFTCRWKHFTSIGSILQSITSILTSIVTILASIEQVNTPLECLCNTVFDKKANTNFEFVKTLNSNILYTHYRLMENNEISLSMSKRPALTFKREQVLKSLSFNCYFSWWKFLTSFG